MDRRAFIEKLFSVLPLGSIFLLAGWGKQEEVEGFGNEERLWDLSSGQKKSEEAIDINYTKKTVLSRDASMGKADPSFVPRGSGG
jgi:hypothetical protein